MQPEAGAEARPGREDAVKLPQELKDAMHAEGLEALTKQIKAEAERMRSRTGREQAGGGHDQAPSSSPKGCDTASHGAEPRLVVAPEGPEAA